MKIATSLVNLTFVLTVIFCFHAHAQEPSEPPSQFEIGIQFSSLTFSRRQPPQSAIGVEPSRTEAGFGGRFTWNLNRHLAFEAEGDFFPHENFGGADNGGRLLQGQFGLKVGRRFGKFGLFVKARPGFASFSKVETLVCASTFDFNGQPITFPVFELKRKTHLSLDVGGVLEFYPARKILTRLDVGDTIIHDSGTSVPANLGLVADSHNSHDLQVSAGIGFRFGSLSPEQTSKQPQPNGTRQWEVGVQFSSLGFTQIEHPAGAPPLFPASDFRDTQTQAGFGGRLTFNVTPNFGLEAQGDFFPRDARLFNGGRAGGRALQGLAGIKLGKRFENFGIFGKARPGVISFGKTISFAGFDNSFGFAIPRIHLARRTYFAFDLGGVLEFYPSTRVVMRFDGGDTMIRYGANQLPIGLASFVVNPAETIHSFEFNAGVGFRF
jgi:hypothetical protein